MNREHCTVLDLDAAGIRLIRQLERAQEERIQRGAVDNIRAEYSLAGLSAVGAWVHELGDRDRAYELATRVAVSTAHVGVRIMPVFTNADWLATTDEALRRVVDADIVETRTSTESLYHSVRRGYSAPGDSSTVNVLLDASGLMREPQPTAYHTFFVASRKIRGLSMQSGPFLLFSAVNVIRITHERQMHPSTTMTDYSSWEDVSAYEVFSLVIIAQLCFKHGAHTMHLTHSDWRIFSRSVDSGVYRLAQLDVASRQLREGGLALRTARLILGHFHIGGMETLPAEEALVGVIEAALDWVEGFFHMAAGSHAAALPAISMRSLAKPLSAYEPIERRRASGY